MQLKEVQMGTFPLSNEVIVRLAVGPLKMYTAACLVKPYSYTTDKLLCFVFEINLIVCPLHWWKLKQLDGKQYSKAVAFKKP